MLAQPDDMRFGLGVLDGNKVYARPNSFGRSKAETRNFHKAKGGVAASSPTKAHSLLSSAMRRNTPLCTFFTASPP